MALALPKLGRKNKDKDTSIGGKANEFKDIDKKSKAKKIFKRLVFVVILCC